MRAAVPFTVLQARRWAEPPACAVLGLHLTAAHRLAPDIQPGSRVRVKADLTVYHVPKNPELQLQGWEGEVVENVVNYKDTKISANLPYKVQFIKPQEGGGKDLKFVSHLVCPRPSALW